MWVVAIALLALGASAAPASLRTHPHYHHDGFDIPTFDVRAYGGRGDGVTMNSAAFASAINAASKAANGTPRGAAVLVAGGTYLTGYIRLLPGVLLVVQPDATVLGSVNSSDYPTASSRWAVVYCEDASGIGITGGGTLDGNARNWPTGWDAPDDEFEPIGWTEGNCTGECRPRLVQFQSCSDIVVQNVTMQYSADWTFHLLNSTDVVVRQVTQYGDQRWPNNDGIDIDSSRNVTVLDSSFDTADDGICIKSSAGYGETAYVTVANCRVRSRSSAIKFGSNTDTDLHDLLFTNITVHDSNRGLGIQQRTCCGDIYNVAYRNITVETRFEPLRWWGSGEAIWVTNIPRYATQGGVGRLWNVSFVGITARQEDLSLLSGSLLGHPLVNVSLKDVAIVVDRWSNTTNVTNGWRDYRPASVLPVERVPSPVYGLFIEGVQGLLLSNVSVTFNPAAAQGYWARGQGACVNATGAGGAVSVNGGSCSPLPA